MLGQIVSRRNYNFCIKFKGNFFKCFILFQFEFLIKFMKIKKKINPYLSKSVHVHIFLPGYIYIISSFDNILKNFFISH